MGQNWNSQRFDIFWDHIVTAFHQGVGFGGTVKGKTSPWADTIQDLGIISGRLYQVYKIIF